MSYNNVAETVNLLSPTGQHRTTYNDDDTGQDGSHQYQGQDQVVIITAVFAVHRRLWIQKHVRNQLRTFSLLKVTRVTDI